MSRNLPIAEGAMVQDRRRSKKPIGEYLVEEQLLTQAELLEALASRLVVDGRRERLGETVVRLGFVTSDDVSRIVAKQHGLEFAGSELPRSHEGAADLVPETLARRHTIVPLWLEPDGTLVVLCDDPTDIVAMDDVRLAAGARRLRPIVAPLERIKTALKNLYLTERAGAAGEIIEMLGDSKGDQDSLDEPIEIVEDAPVIRLAEQIIHDALHGAASDIHIEPTASETVVRYRIDGVLSEIMRVPRSAHGALVSRLKLIAAMDIAERRRPQDGRATYRSKSSEVDLRVSTLPLLHGEKVVMRLLRKGAEQLQMIDVGFSEAQLAHVVNLIERPQGLCLLTGPTGAGKTSTLYAFLSHLASVERNLITVEDPIEYELPLVNQTQVAPKINYTFMSALKTVLRQDPDVVMVGEIRDKETAELALQASLTGHMVFSTLHTNDAPGAVTRLADIGIPEFLIASSLTMVVAQRLGRRACKRCATPTEPDERTVERVGLTPAQLAQGDWRAGRGCNECEGRGYKGRMGFFEILTVDGGVREALSTGASEERLRIAGFEGGMRSLRQDGIAKAMAGITTLQEVLRVTPADLSIPGMADAELAPIELPNVAESDNGYVPGDLESIQDSFELVADTDAGFTADDTYPAPPPKNGHAGGGDLLGRLEQILGGR